MIKEKNVFYVVVLFCLILFSVGFRPATDFTISARVEDPLAVRISFESSLDFSNHKIILYRSTAELAGPDINKIRYPIAEFHIDSDQNPATFIDQSAAHNAAYLYFAVLKQKDWDETLATSNTIKISTPDVTVEQLEEPVILVNKRYYYLEIQNNGKMVKRYPVSLGRDPFKRKLHQDNKTTPEGVYKIINLQARATFYKAIDIDYPNPLDRIRYDFMKKEGLVPNGRGIGGEIQIHGQAPRWGSIHRNWTWGCISLRNEDMDEILNLATIKVGIPVVIFGYDFSLEDMTLLEEERSLDDIKSVQTMLEKMGFYEGKIDGVLGRLTRFAIGHYQKDQGLPISCVLDSKTTNMIEKLLETK